MQMLDVRGTPREVGRAIGEAAQDRLRHALADVRQEIRTLPQEQIEATAAGLVGMLEQWVPAFHEEIFGIAEGAGLMHHEITILASAIELVSQSRDQEASVECTTFGAGGSQTQDGDVILGSNKDTTYRFGGQGLVVRRHTPGQPARLDFISLAGFQRFGNLNERGMAKLGTGVRVRSRRPGLPSSASVELALSAPDLATVRTAYTHAPWSSGWTSVVTDGRKMVLAEASPQRAVAEEVDGDVVVTTNHFASREMRRLGPRREDFPSSYIRRERMAALLSAGGPITVEGAIAALRDHANGPGNDSICRHDDANGQGTIFSIVQRPAMGEMWLALGHPCVAQFSRFTL